MLHRAQRDAAEDLLCVTSVRRNTGPPEHRNTGTPEDRKTGTPSGYGMATDWTRCFNGSGFGERAA